ncbi:AraC family transcriptional regulator [Nakamurella flava]|uniref:AraC family transcriptional regulator n=1 Tax=Nakamurella flava TaxID=2576308 RepID=A0A4U6QJE2_9ACTN|nr:helix-turn-helix domain-containing protein [Nakamurella flava]TKV60543.1 AraC family transcriptional regulator [Nakamurella flava]
MKPDSSVGQPARAERDDPVERAHLRDPADRSHTMYRYPVTDELTDLVRRYWVPVWSVPAGQAVEQHVLQYPCALLVVSTDYARFYGVTAGLSRTTLQGAGWAVGVLCQPATGWLLTRRSMADYRDQSVDLVDLLGDGAPAVVANVRAAMAADPHSPAAHQVAVAALAAVLAPCLPVDPEGRLVNDIVAAVEADTGWSSTAPALDRVARLAAHVGLSERALQRVVRRRVGLSPKWLIQRHRLHQAAGRLRDTCSPADLAALAADLGYADQAHFTRDFRTVTGQTPGEFARRYR